uniref:Uncharacterized protein n=1 Tax=Anguilla anguilla TaxID=7936 RepID=A0A0E9PZW0_ANGAN
MCQLFVISSKCLLSK